MNCALGGSFYFKSLLIILVRRSTKTARPSISGWQTTFVNHFLSGMLLQVHSFFGGRTYQELDVYLHTV